MKELKPNVRHNIDINVVGSNKEIEKNKLKETILEIINEDIDFKRSLIEALIDGDTIDVIKDNLDRYE